MISKGCGVKDIAEALAKTIGKTRKFAKSIPSEESGARHLIDWVKSSVYPVLLKPSNVSISLMFPELLSWRRWFAFWKANLIKNRTEDLKSEILREMTISGRCKKWLVVAMVE